MLTLTLAFAGALVLAALFVEGWPAAGVFAPVWLDVFGAACPAALLGVGCTCEGCVLLLALGVVGAALLLDALGVVGWLDDVLLVGLVCALPDGLGAVVEDGGVVCAVEGVAEPDDGVAVLVFDGLGLDVLDGCVLSCVVGAGSLFVEVVELGV